MMKKTILFLVFIAGVLMASAQPPANYYNSANGLTGNELKVALHNIIKGHTTISYSQIWNAFWSTDNKGNGVVWDMYSDRPNGTPAYQYSMAVDQCSSDGCGSENCCYNREHSWAQSWFNKNNSTPRTDLHHIFATDCWVNNQRSNHPFGEVRTASSTFTNGSKLGPSKTPGYSGTVFEPIDEYKGDFARALMYMSVRYYTEDTNWNTSDMTNKSEIKPWAIAMLLRWNKLDPVSQKEIDRNNAIYNDYQHNRNPFIDHPEYADMIWDPSWSVTGNQVEPTMVYPNPVIRGDMLHIGSLNQNVDQVIICDIMGRVMVQADVAELDETNLEIPQTLQKGMYLLRFMKENRTVTNRKLLIN